MNDETQTPGWERRLLEKLASEAYREQKRARRWGIFFKLLGFGYLFLILILAFSGAAIREEGLISSKEHVGTVDVQGVISNTTESNAETINEGLRDAFEADNTKAVVLRINSPGGSPVQSAYVYDEIKRLREEYPDKPVYAVISDIGASGAYYIASAADKIYANPASIVGSIGVLMNGFGFTRAMDKLGVERRLLTAGENKGMLDPFSPQEPEEITHMKGLLGEVHQEFIDAVKQGRGDRLADKPEIFSGLFWGGRQSRALGLIDDFGDVSFVAREVVGVEETVDYTRKPDVWQRFADRLGSSAAQVVIDSTGFDLTTPLR